MAGATRILFSPLSEQAISMKRTPAELFQWTESRKRIDKLLRDHYRACTSQELSPQVLAVLKKLREETEVDHVKIIGETKG
jgi:hypothetical protein